MSYDEHFSAALVLQAGVTADELAERVAGPVWERWTSREPDLLMVGSLADLDARRGLAGDPALGALIRLAARDGADDDLAAIAVLQQLQGGVRRLCWRLRDLSDDIEVMVVGELWQQIRTFPWRRRTRAYAANLLLDTRAAVLRELRPNRGADGQLRVVPVDCSLGRLDAIAGVSRNADLWPSEPVDSHDDLVDLVAWAWAGHVISDRDVELLVDLLRAGHAVAGASGSVPKGRVV